MRVSPEHDAQAPRSQPLLALRRRARKTRLVRRVRQALAPIDAETTFWAWLEEREDGRIAQEVDHLFDTSYPWAT